MALTKIIHYPDTNSVEVTWVDAEGVQVKCHSYADVQMDMLRADLGDDAATYADLIALVEANIKPPAPLTPTEINQAIDSQINSLEGNNPLGRATREFMLISFATTAAANGVDPNTSPAYVKIKSLDDQIAALRKQRI